MKKQIRRKQSANKDTMRSEYDFSKGVRGKHAAKYAEGTNVVVLEPDVAREFQTTEQVNETLRAVSKLLQQHRKAHQGQDVITTAVQMSNWYLIDHCLPRFVFPRRRSGSLGVWWGTSFSGVDPQRPEGPHQRGCTQ